MRVLLVRHARAGERSAWEGDDRLRPLDKKGRRQAEALVRTLEELGVERLVSSPYVRCTQTLDPTAAALGLPVETRDDLGEGAGRSDVLRLVGELTSVAALCTHGDVLEAVGCAAKKGAVWIVDEELRRERYVPPEA